MEEIEFISPCLAFLMVSFIIDKKNDFFFWFSGRSSTSALLQCFPPLTLPSDIVGREIWHRAEWGDLIIKLFLCGRLFSIQQLVICVCSTECRGHFAVFSKLQK